MKPTRDNYEIFFIDYFDGNLSESQQADLMEFLVQNPDLKAEFDSFEPITLSDGNPLTMPGKENLKKMYVNHLPVEGEMNIESAPVTDEMLIALLENDLEISQQAKLNSRIENDPALKQRFAQYRATILQPDHTVVFDNKYSLKRYTLSSGTTIIMRRLAVAAAIAGLIVTTYFMLPQRDDNQLVTTHTQKDIQQENFNSIIMPDTDYSVPQSVEPKPVDIPVNTHSSPSTKPETEVKLEIRPEERPRILHSNRIAYLPSSTQVELASISSIPQTISTRDEFYWFSFVGNTPVEEQSPAQEYQENNLSPIASFASLAYQGIERTTGWDVQGFEDQVRNRKFGIWDLAGQGLASIGQLTGTSLAIEKELDEDGNITSLGIGDRFKISRQKAN